VSDVAIETVSFVDPVTGQPVTLSVAGIAIAIKTKMIDWMEKDQAATYDPESDLVVINDPGQ
jgi:hypothetical protein